jgi:ProP effector
MNDSTSPTASTPQPRQGGRPQRRPNAPKTAAPRPAARAPHPLLDQLAALYPHLFGAEFLPLKRGIFQDLQAAHPEALEREALKAALALHTRSTRYLTSVAAGLKRHDLQGNAVEDMAPEHVYQALVEVFRRRQSRSEEDLSPKLRNRIIQAFEASGLQRADYAELVRSSHNEAANAVLLRAFDASGLTVEVFAGNYGLEVQAAHRTLERARQRLTT